MPQGEAIPITHERLQALLIDKVDEIAREPEYTWQGGFKSLMRDSDGRPVARLGIANCPPGADGAFAENLLQQKHRFFEDALDFDFGSCCRERGQKATQYDDYVCVCAARQCARRKAFAGRPTMLTA